VTWVTNADSPGALQVTSASGRRCDTDEIRSVVIRRGFVKKNSSYMRFHVLTEAGVEGILSCCAV
jgi:hypothetical protein